jgi:2-keto-4-pentenoate hydratase/2-oxohepta-3-ene-1,7-dioic acid hydratase in catechol pathway
MVDYRLLNYGDNVAEARPAVCVGDTILDIQDALADVGNPKSFAATSTLTILEKWDAAEPVLEQIADKLANGHAKAKKLSSVKLQAPLLYPPAIFNAGSNYSEHQAEMGQTYETDKSKTKPYMFLKSPAHTVIGPGHEIRIPHVTKQVDWEGEFGVVIGRYGRNVSKDNARSVIAGYTIFNDLSARDLGAREDWPRFRTDWFGHKTFEGSGPMGPWIVPAKQIKDPYQCRIETFVNEERKQNALAGEMIFNIEEQIEYISARLTLRPGDLISTGTPSGVGRPKGTFLQPGDTVRIAISGIGELKNPVVAGI